MRENGDIQDDGSGMFVYGGEFGGAEDFMRLDLSPH